MPPMGPPPRKNRTGMVIGIIAVALVVLGGLGFAVTKLLGTAGGFPEAKYRLTVPQTILNGQYTLAQDLSEKGRESLKNTSQADIRDPQPAMGQYSGAKGDGTSMVLSGIYGRVKAPERERDSMLRGAREADGATIVMQPKDATPMRLGRPDLLPGAVQDAGRPQRHVPDVRLGRQQHRRKRGGRQPRVTRAEAHRRRCRRRGRTDRQGTQRGPQADRLRIKRAPSGCGPRPRSH